MQNNSVLERSYINDFHRQSSLAALKGEQYMLLHPYSREQKLAQINSLRQNTVSKESSNSERSKRRELAIIEEFKKRGLLFPFYLVYSLAGNSLLIQSSFFIPPRNNYPLPSYNPSHGTYCSALSPYSLLQTSSWCLPHLPRTGDDCQYPYP